jgi:uncharacterized protein (DUF697 family)
MNSTADADGNQSAAQSAPQIADQVAGQAKSVAPIIWLLGKVQSGKSSIVHGLTGSTRAQIGNGFRACTVSADIFEFPEELPLIRFLDTRGLGEAHYDPADDLAIAESSSHCTIAVMRAMDQQQDVVLNILEHVRKRHADWPILVAQTHLHEGYPVGGNHAVPYPFSESSASDVIEAPSVPEDLRRSLNYQRAMLNRLPGNGAIAFVPIDFTLPEDGYTPQLYGLKALQEQLTVVGPAALRAALDDANGQADREADPDMHRLIVGHAAAASAADLIPVAAVAAVPAVQGRMLQVIGRRHGFEWTKRTMLEFSGALGLGLLARYAAGFGIRQLTKLIPVYGQTAGTAAAAATSFATTYALGKAADYFLNARRRGQTDDAALQKVWADSLREAFNLAKVRGLGDKPNQEP